MYFLSTLSNYKKSPLYLILIVRCLSQIILINLLHSFYQIHIESIKNKQLQTDKNLGVDLACTSVWVVLAHVSCQNVKSNKMYTKIKILITCRLIK